MAGLTEPFLVFTEKTGPDGVAMVVLCRGVPIEGANPYASQPPFWVDPALDQLTGLGPSQLEGGEDAGTEGNEVSGEDDARRLQGAAGVQGKQGGGNEKAERADTGSQKPGRREG